MAQPQRLHSRRLVHLLNAAASPLGARVTSRGRPLRRPCRLRVRAAANLDVDGGASSGGSCPFLAFRPDERSAGAAAAGAVDVASMRGANWRALPPSGGGSPLPEPQGRWCFNPLVGEYLELEAKGAGAFLLERFREFGPVFTWQLGGRKVVTIVDYDACSSLLKLGDSKVMVGWNPEAMYAMLGEGARRSLENPAVRAVTRRALAPGFSREALRGYMGKLVNICATQLDAWAASGAPVALTSEGKALSFEFSTQLLVEFDVPLERKADLKAKFDALFQGMLAPPIRLPGTRFSKGLAAKAALEADVADIMRQRSTSSSSSHVSVLDYNLAGQRESMGRDLTDREVAEAGIGLIIAGNDTSGLGVTALLAILPHFPGVLEALREEQQQVIAEHGPEVTVAALDAMPYAEAVVKEVLRVAPPSAQVMRRAVVDMEICGRFVKAGSILQLSSFMGQVLTDPRLHPEGLSSEQLAALEEQHWGAAITTASLAEDFRPERWLAPAAAAAAATEEPGASLPQPEQSEQQLQRPSTLLTFSQGPHACLGLSLFMAEAKVLVSLIARGYDLQPATAAADGDGGAQPAAAAAGEEPEPVFSTTFVTQLRRGAVRVSRLPSDQALPFSGKDKTRRSSSSSSVAAAPASAAAVPAAAAAAAVAPHAWGLAGWGSGNEAGKQMGVACGCEGRRDLGSVPQGTRASVPPASPGGV